MSRYQCIMPIKIAGYDFLNRGSAIRLGKIVTGRFGPAGYLGAGREAII